MEQLHALLFAYPQIILNGKAINPERRKVLALLAYLLVEGQAHSRESLATFLWPEQDGQQALASLRHALWEIRKLIGEDWLELEGKTVRLKVEKGAWVDTRRFVELSEAADPQASGLQEAADLYRGDFLAGFSLRDSAEFDDWQVVKAEALRRAYDQALEKLSLLYAASADLDSAAAVARRRVELDPLNEAAQRVLIELLARSGQRTAAVRQYEACQRALLDELGVEPEPETAAVYQQVLSGQLAAAVPAAHLTATRQPSAAMPETASPAGNLPVGTGGFVGRGQELEQVAQMLSDPACRLLTISGPGGAGKTSLALQAARSQAHLFPDGAWFVPLASITSPAAIPLALAQALGIPLPVLWKEAQGGPLGLVKEYVRHKRLLLLVDNLEHLMGAEHPGGVKPTAGVEYLMGAEHPGGVKPTAGVEHLMGAEDSEGGVGVLQELVESAAGIRILATSRERLNLAGEWVLEISGLPVPGFHSEGDIAEYEAAQLFLAAARRVKAGFQPSGEDWQAIERICQQVDGLPLGLELAAAWVRLLSCREIADEMERTLDFLYSSPRGAAERQRSLRAAFDYSWNLLSESERVALGRLAVFQGGFTRQAAAQAAGVALPLLLSLADKSLLEGEDSGRFDLHRVLHQYAYEKLAQNPAELHRLRTWHSTYYLHQVCDWLEDLKGSQQLRVITILTEEQANLQAAWSWAIEQENVELIYQAAVSLLLSFIMRGQRMESFRFFEPALALARKVGDLPLLALLLAAECNNAVWDVEFRRHYFDESVLLIAQTPDSVQRAYAMLLLSSGPTSIPDLGIPFCNQCEKYLHAHGDDWGASMALLVKADNLNFGVRKYRAAEEAYLLSMENFKKLSNPWGVGLCLRGLAYVAAGKKEYGRAIQLWVESFPIFEQFGDQNRNLETGYDLGCIYLATGEYQKCLEILRPCLPILKQLGWSDRLPAYQDLIAQAERED